MEREISFSEDSFSDVFIQKPKPKIIKNFGIQKPLQAAFRQNLQKEAIEKIINDPALSQFVSPPISKDVEVEKVFEVKKEDKVEDGKDFNDIGTQMTDRGNLCNCSKLKLSHASNQTCEEVQDAREQQSVSVCESVKSFNNESCNTDSYRSFKYTSPLFRTPTLSSQVFKQRINFRVMKMNSLNIY